MTKLEKYGLKQLKEFVKTAGEMGLCFNGKDMDIDMQAFILALVMDYIEDYEELEK